jgi:hypothetical protein
MRVDLPGSASTAVVPSPKRRTILVPGNDPPRLGPGARPDSRIGALSASMLASIMPRRAGARLLLVAVRSATLRMRTGRSGTLWTTG